MNNVLSLITNDFKDLVQLISTSIVLQNVTNFNRQWQIETAFWRMVQAI